MLHRAADGGQRRYVWKPTALREIAVSGICLQHRPTTLFSSCPIPASPPRVCLTTFDTLAFSWRCTVLTMPASPQLFNEANPFSPVAWFRTAHRRQIDGIEVQEAPSLSLLPEVEAVQEYVMGSLLLVEQKYRMMSQRASGMGPHMAMRSAFSNPGGTI